MTRLDLQGKGVLVNGATGGIGKEIARELLRRGAKVAVASRPSERLDELVDELGPDEVFKVAADVTDRKAVVEGTDEAAEHFGGLHAVVAGAGVVLTGTIAEQSEEDCRTVIDTNLYGTLWTLQAALPHIDRTGGHLLALASIAAIAPIPLSGIYPATKAAVGEMIAQLRIELMHRPTSAGVFYLGMVDTQMSAAIGDDERIDRALDATPGPLTTALKADVAARRIVDAIERRQGATVAPLWQLPVALPQLGVQKMIETGMRFTAIARELPRGRSRPADRG
jgi:NADP-dependent 3-hydroxy acid dehydrogenase YdfG